MLSYGYWQRRFGGDRSVVGRTIIVDSRPKEIVGVMPQGFRIVNAEADLIFPLAFDRERLTSRRGFNYQGVARLKPGVTIAQANADMARMVPIWMNSWSDGPGTNPRVYETWKIAPALRPLKQEVVGGVTDVLWVVMATIGLVMLIACANVANLLLVRAEVRQRELSLRAALGAGRGRIVRGLLVESVLLGSDRRRAGSRARVRRLARVAGHWSGESSTAERNLIGLRERSDSRPFSRCCRVCCSD